jgi:uncharacterized repeat protein (TIGR03803 family)
MKVLYSFKGGPSDGSQPYSSMVMDAAGNLYGTTLRGGSDDAGIIFKVDISGNETVLQNFGFGSGIFPIAGLVMDKAGNLYGVATQGGGAGNGTVFKFDRSTNLLAPLHSFTGTPNDGAGPLGALTTDADENLYGTTYYGGAHNYGSVFKLDMTGNETVLYSFAGAPMDGSWPVAGLYMDKTGNLYGNTYFGGVCGAEGFDGYGTMFKLDLTGKETIIYNFTDGSTACGSGRTSGASPEAPMVMDASGNLYGTCETYSASGAVFRIDAAGNFTLIHFFSGAPTDGYLRDITFLGTLAALLIDQAGKLFGTTGGGGEYDYGTVYKLDTTTGAETILYSFGGSPTDGAKPRAGLIEDAAGNLYGTTSEGGTYGYGTVFELQISQQLVLSPTTSSPNTGDTETLTATAKANDGTPLIGLNVTFAVTGANPASGTGVTDTSGQATFSYIGTNAGTDTVIASATINGNPVTSNQATVQWTAIGPPPSSGGTITITSDLPSATFTLSPAIAGAPTGEPYPTTIQNAPAGQYTITFEPVQGYVTPSLLPQTLANGGSILFAAHYAPLPQVVIVPGILGTKLASQNDPVHCPTGDPSCVQWLSNDKITRSLRSLVLGVSDPFAFSALKYDSYGNSTEPLVPEDILNFTPDPTGNPLDKFTCNEFPFTGCSTWGRDVYVYDTLRDNLQQAGFTVSSFPYDWRMGLPALSDQLYAAIRALIREYPQQPVALVAHSMGGLIVSEMLARHTDITPSLSNIVTVGTPFQGSVHSYLNLQGWESLEIFLSPNGTKELGQYWASPYFLLPQQDFVTDLDGNLVPNSKVFGGQFMPGLFPALVRPVAPPVTVIGSSAPKTLAIIGSGIPTYRNIVTFNAELLPGLPPITCLDFAPGNGDGTVTVASASSTSSGITQQLFVNEVHQRLPSNDAVIGAIISFLSGVTPGTTDQLHAKEFLPPKSVDAEVCSPADLSMQASDGETVANGLVQVLGAHYVSSPHGAQIMVPATDQYDLTVRGTGLGTFTLILTERNEDMAVSQRIVFADVPVAPSMTGSLTVAPTGPGKLQLTIGTTTIALAPGVSPTAADDVQLLSAIISTLPLPPGTSTSLRAMLATASDAITRGNVSAAAGTIVAFRNAVQAQAGKYIPPPVASGLTSIANVISGLLSSSSSG